MPLSVMQSIEVDYCLPISSMPGVIQKKSQDSIEQTVPIPEDVLIEAKLDRSVSVSMNEMQAFEKSIFNCPDCGGGLYITQKENPTHYRCHVGHSFTEDDLLIRQSEAMEATLWTALRMMEERRSLLMRLHKKDSDNGLVTLAQSHLRKAEELKNHIDNLKLILIESKRA
jgi:two-component system, chemotaxis family, protein-glutamate methylesterase/glutaminase